LPPQRSDLGSQVSRHWRPKHRDVAARVRINLEPGQILHIDSDETTSLNLRCTENAATLRIVDDDELVRSDVTAQEHPITQPVSANASETVMRPQKP